MRKFLALVFLLSTISPFIQPETVWASSQATWSTVTKTGSAVSNAAVSSSGQYISVFANGGCMYYSQDYGATFSTALTLGSGATFCSSAFNTHGMSMSANGQIQYAVDGSGNHSFYESVDFGAHWSDLTVPVHYACGISSNGAGTQILLGCDSGTLYLGVNNTILNGSGGSWTWSPVSTTCDGAIDGFSSSTDSGIDGKYLYYVCSSGTAGRGGVWSSSNFGASWSLLPLASSNTANYQYLAASSSGAILTLSVTSSGIWRSTNFGVTWTQLKSDGYSYYAVYGQQGLTTSANGTLIVAAAQGQGSSATWLSTDSGATWAAQPIGCSSAFAVVLSSDGSREVCLKNDASIQIGTFPTSTTTQLSTSSTTPTYGQVDTLTAVVQTGGATAVGATGSINFKNNGSSIVNCGTVAISAGVATCSFIPGSATTYANLSATYSGGGNLATSDSAATSITVSKAVLTITPSPTSVVYGNTPNYLYGISGYVNGDGASVNSGSPSCSSTYTSSTAVGNPIIFSCATGTMSASNYTYTSSGAASLTITRATPTVSLTLNSATPSYGSVDTVTATSSVAGSVTFTAGGTSIVGCSSLSTTVSSPFTAICLWTPPAVTNYSLAASFLPTDSTNFNSAISNSLTPTAGKASITVTPTSGQSKIYGTQDPTLTYSITSGALIGTDQLSGALTYASASQNTAVGNYAISLGTLANTNYIISLTPGVTFAINQAPQASVSLSSLSTPYNPTNKTVTLTGSGGSGSGAYSYALNSGNSTSGCSVSGSTLTYVTAGTCIIDVTRAASTNYLAQTNTVSFSIGMASQSITFASLASRNYSSDTFTVSASTTSGLTVSFTSGSPSICTTSGANGSVITLLGVGTCIINADQPGDSNTSSAPTVSQNFLVNPRLITVTADAKTKPYGAVDPILTYVVTTGSVLTGDSVTGTLTRAAGSDVGQYAITAGTLTSANNPKYAITFVSANLTISQIAPTLTLTYPNNSVVILTPGVTDTPTVKSSTSNGTLTFAVPTTTSICSADPVTGVLSFMAAGICQVTMTSASTINYLQAIDTETVTSVLQSTSLAGIPSGNLVPMGGIFYASPVLTQTITGTSGSNGASVSIPANALPSTTAISVNLLTDASSQLALISGASSSVLSVVVSWVSPDGSVPQTAPGLPISVTLTNPAIKSGAKVYSVLGGVSTLVGTATTDGSVTSLITSDPVLIVVNPVVVATPPTSGGGGGYVAPTPVDNSASIAAAKALPDQQAADAAAKALADQQAADVAAKALADQQAADAAAKAAAEAQAAKDAAAAAASIKPAITLYSISPKLTLSTYDTAYLQRYVRALKNGAAVTCLGYIYKKGTTMAKATALAKSQATAVCNLMKKINKTFKVTILLADSAKAPKAAVGAKWVAVSYRVDSFKSLQ